MLSLNQDSFRLITDSAIVSMVLIQKGCKPKRPVPKRPHQKGRKPKSPQTLKALYIKGHG